MSNRVFVKYPGYASLSERQWRRLEVVEIIDGISATESIDRAGRIKLIGRATSVWVTEYLKRWKAGFDNREADMVNGESLTKRLVEMAWK